MAGKNDVSRVCYARSLVRFTGYKDDAITLSKDFLGLAEAPAAMAALGDPEDGKGAKRKLDDVVSPQRQLDRLEEKVNGVMRLSPAEAALHERPSQLVFRSPRFHGVDVFHDRGRSHRLAPWRRWRRARREEQER